MAQNKGWEAPVEDMVAFPAADKGVFPAGADNRTAASEDGVAAAVAGSGRAFYPGGMNRRIGGYNGYTSQSPALPEIA